MSAHRCEVCDCAPAVGEPWGDEACAECIAKQIINTVSYTRGGGRDANLREIAEALLAELPQEHRPVAQWSEERC